jgi:aspartate racemase
MKTAGIVGGIAPESTIEYYRQIIRSYREQKNDGSYPQIVINSIDLTKMIGMIAANQLAEVTRYLADEVNKLERAGADFGLFASNTPHIVFDEIACGAKIPLISIVEVTCLEVLALGLKRVGLFGTRFTMQGRFYPDVFSKRGIAVVAPLADEQTYIHEKYMGELVNGKFLPQTHEQLLQIVDRMHAREKIDGLILGGTELPLILTETARNGIPFLDTTKIHVRRVVEEMLS